MLDTGAFSSIRAGALWVLGALAVALGAGALLGGTPYDTSGGAVIVGLSLVILAVLVVPRAVSGDERRFMLQLLAVAIVAKAVATHVRWYLSFNFYGGDALRYNSAGRAIAEQLRQGEFEQVASQLELGTPFMEFATGTIFLVTGSTVYGASLVISSLAFLGTFLLYKAFRVAFPLGNWRLFAVLVFFYPSLLYWPSGLSKDALTLFFIGLAAYGTAQVLAAGRWGGIAPILLGLAGTLLIRPHIAGMLAAAAVIAFVFGASRSGRALTLGRVLAQLIAVGGALFFMFQAVSFLGLESARPGAALAFLADQAANVFEGEGGTSNFVTTPVTDPLWAPMAFATVLFRPFPWEAHNLPALIQSLDGLFMGALLVWGSRRLWRAVRQLGKEPYLGFVVVFIVMLVLALSTLGNFGLLARQRSTLLPFVLMLVAFAPSAALSKGNVQDEVRS